MPVGGIGPSGPQGRFEGVQGPRGAPQKSFSDKSEKPEGPSIDNVKKLWLQIKQEIAEGKQPSRGEMFELQLQIQNTLQGAPLTDEQRTSLQSAFDKLQTGKPADQFEAQVILNNLFG